MIQDNLTSSSVSYSSGLKSVFRKLYFREGLVWREGLSTVEIKLSFQITAALCWRCLNVNATTLTATKTSTKRSLMIRTLAMHVRIFCSLLYEIDVKYTFSSSENMSTYFDLFWPHFLWEFWLFLPTLSVSIRKQRIFHWQLILGTR